MKHILRWSWRILLACALSLFAYCGYALTDSWYFQRTEHKELERIRFHHADEPVQTVSAALLTDLPHMAADGLLGRMEIPRLGLSVMVIEGTGRTTLRRAAGHIPGTALPGQPGNVGISAHRDTFFRPLRNIAQSDVITLTTPAGIYSYRVVSTSVVTADNVSVLNPTSRQILTLVTCYPFYFVGPAPDRFIVRAERI